MVKALKGDPIKGYVEANIKGKNVRFNQSNAADFVKRIPPTLAKLIKRHVEGPATIVPIPNSHVVSVDAPDFKTLDLANAVAAASGGQFTTAPALVFREPQAKSRGGGGTRDPYILEEEYRIAEDVQGPIVLLDDVCTSGGHLIGARWKLETPDREIVLACAFGRATKERVNEPIGPREEILIWEKFGDN
jgi:predicted amidophosphoribosyltransferase